MRLVAEASMSIIVRVPTINDDKADFIRLFELWHQVSSDRNVIFDFSCCRFLRPNAVAFLGGLARLIENRSGKVIFAWDTLREEIRANLAQNGFIHSFDGGVEPWLGNSVPYREYPYEDRDNFVNYLQQLWLGRDWVHISPILQDLIVDRVYEIFANAFEHSSSSIGVFTCGQNFPRQSQLKLTIADFGIGIPGNVRPFLGKVDIPASKCIEWAFQRGNTTRRKVPGGEGLDWLKEFVKINKGTLEVFSQDGYALIDETGEIYDTFVNFFKGTLVNITLQCDEAYYHLDF